MKMILDFNFGNIGLLFLFVLQNSKSNIIAESDGYSSNNNNHIENKPAKLNSCDLSDSSARKDQSCMKIEHNSG